MSTTPAIWERCDGHGWPSAPTASRTRFGNVPGHRGPESRHERQDRPPLPRPPHAARRAEEVVRAADVPHAARSVRGGLALGRGAAQGRAATARQDALRLAAARASGAVLRFAPPHLRTPRPAVAGDSRAGEVHHVPPGPRGRRPRGLRLHPHELAEHHGRRPAVRPHGVPLRADLLELGIRDGVRLRVVRGVVRRPAERALGTGRRAAAAPHRQFDRGREQPVGDPRVPDPVPRPAGALRRVGPADQRAAGARERRRGVVARALQDRGRPGAVAPRQPGVCRPRRVRRVPAAGRDDAERGSRGPLRRGSRGAAAPARLAAVVVPEGAVPRRHRQPDPHSPQRLLGAQPADRRGGRSVAVRRPRRGLVRGPVRRHAAATGGSRPARGELPARHRLPGPQAGRVRELRLPRRPVPDDALPPGLRPLLRGPRRTARRQGLFEDPAPCGPRRRGGRRRRAPHPAGGRRPPVAGCGDRAGAVGRGAAGGDGGRRGTAGPEAVRCPVDTHGGDPWRRRSRSRRTRRRRRSD